MKIPNLKHTFLIIIVYGDRRPGTQSEFPKPLTPATRAMQLKVALGTIPGRAGANLPSNLFFLEAIDHQALYVQNIKKEFS